MSNEMRIEYQDLDTLLRAERNPKQHDKASLRASMNRWGFTQPLAVDDRTGRIVEGHGRLDVLQELRQAGAAAPIRVQVKGKKWLVPVVRGVSFASDAEAEAYLIAANQLTRAGGWNDNLLNQMMADLGEALERHKAHVTAYLGGGFMALLRDAGHADRAVQAALDLVAVAEAFNRPRAVLGLRQVPVRIGIATGTVSMGNIGTYRRMDFTAIGKPVNLAARLMRNGNRADWRWPCISRKTYEMIGDRFTFAPQNPRRIELTEMGTVEVWDVIGRKGETS